MKEANLDRLKDKIVRPDFDEKLVPLLLYRGALSLGRAQRMWNFALTMMESEAETLADATKLSLNPEFAHLCGPHSKIPLMGARSFFSRLYEQPKVTDNIPGLTAYIRDVFRASGRFVPFRLMPVPLNGYRVRAPWRIEDGRPAARTNLVGGRAEKLLYPFVIHKPKNGGAEYDLMVEVNNAVPKYLPSHLRADICQDLIVAILAGDIERSALRGSVKDYSRKVLKMHPLKYGDLSLDAPLPGSEGGRTLHDTLGGLSY